MKKILIIITILVLATAASAYAASPVIFYSDLTSGPNTGGQNNKGSFVTIWGKNFGSTRGTSYVSVGGGQADNYPVWSDTEITFQLGSNTSTGNITVTTSEGTSNGIPFTIRSGNIYFASTAGSDSSGDGSWSNPFRTIPKLKNSLAAGDIGYICDGVTQTTQDDYSAYIDLNSSGTSTNPKALVAYPGATVTVGVSGGLERGFHNYISGGGSASYWVISKLNIRAGHTGINAGFGFRIVGNDISVPGNIASAAVECGYGSLRLLGNEFHNCGASNATKLYHNIYCNNHTGSTNSDIEIAWNIVRDSTANRGIQIYSDGTGSADISDVRIHDNLMYNLKGNAININVHTAGTVKVYNNIIYKAGQGPQFSDGSGEYEGIYIDGNSATIYMYANTIYDCGYSGAASPGETGLVKIGSSYSGTLYFRNNILYSNGSSYEEYLAPNSKSPSAGANRNLFYGKGSAPSWDTAAINSDPKFVNLGNYDFRLQSTSPAKDAGYDISSIVARDYDGVARPQGSGCDIGAYEYVSKKVKVN